MKVEDSAQDNGEFECPIHGHGCHGHLSIHSGTVLCPHFYIKVGHNKEPNLVGKYTEQLMQRRISQSEYSSAMMTTLMTKKGQLRYKCAGSRPVHSARGVAVPQWTHPDHIFLPEIWRDKIVITYPDDHGTYQESKVQEDDWVIVLRCPSISEESAQPVMVKFWSHFAVGVHPKLCFPLHLDFDGDEVHVYFVKSSICQRECKKLREHRKYDKFDVEDINKDMSLSTLSIVRDYSTELEREYKIAGVKSNHYSAMKNRMRSRTLNFREYHAKSTSSIDQGTIGKLSVGPESALARKSKFAVCKMHGSSHVSNPTAGPSVKCPFRSYGLPAMRSVFKLCNSLVQNALDTAKSKGSRASIAQHCLIAMMRTRPYCRPVVPESFTPQAKGIVESFWRNSICIEKDHVQKVRLSIKMVTRLSSMMNISISDSETFHFSCALAYLSEIDEPICGDGRSKMMSKVDSDWMTASVCENLSVLKKSAPDGNRVFCTNLTTATIMCNMTDMYDNSILEY